jgi:hypothetical protein
MNECFRNAHYIKGLDICSGRDILAAKRVYVSEVNVNHTAQEMHGQKLRELGDE